MKSTPKSCGCKHCRISRGYAPVKKFMKAEERAFRHAAKIAVNKGKDEDVTPAFSGARYG